MLVALAASFVLTNATHADTPKPTSSATAQRIDALLQGKSPPPAAVDDEAFLRRVCLDLTGRLPSAEETQRFLADRDPERRIRLVDRLLESDAHAVNWGRYWRDTLTYNTPASGNYIRWKSFDEWCTRQIRANRPWNEVVTALVTASGPNDELAPVNFLTAYYGNPVEMAATTSRVFLGVQIQCAQCHNAKTEPWKREQFHEFAAFFGRARLIQHKDVQGRGTPYAIESRSDGQYFMTDKKDPTHLIAMQPRFLTGEAVSIDASDAERRAALAKFMTSPKSPWFARCYVNRIWTALMGWGFYPTVADLGTDVRPRMPKVLEALEKDWIASGYDTRWLFRTIMQTQAYQRELQVPPSDNETVAACGCPVRLRGEQVFEALQTVLRFDETDRTIPAPAPSSSPALQRHTGLRHMIYHAFKADPSTPGRDLTGTIPQALLMMNSTLVSTYTSADGKTILAELLAKKLSDEDTIAALYQRVLVRKPTPRERDICLQYLGSVENRKEALEDVLWSLVNSTEFLIKK
jgi:hypothetical protein